MNGPQAPEDLNHPSALFMILAPQQTAHIASVGLAFPSHVVDQDDTIAVQGRLFPKEDAAKIRCMVSRSGVERRHIVPTLEEVLAPSDFSQRNRTYRAAYSPTAKTCLPPRPSPSWSALASPPEGDGDREALLLAIGPGLSVEMALLCWDGTDSTSAA